MEARILEATLISARDLKNASIFSKTKAFAVAWISNNQKSRQWTAVDKDNGTDPTWNQVMNFILHDADLQQGRLHLEIVIYRTATFGDKEIGRVRIPLNEFLNPANGKKGGSASAQFVSYQVRKPSGKPKGVLNLSVKITEKAEVKHPQVATGSYGMAKPEPVTAYPVYPPAGWFSHPSPYSPAIYFPQAIYPPLPTPEQAIYSPQAMYAPLPTPEQAIYTLPPLYNQGYHAPLPCYQSYPIYQGYPPDQVYPPIVPAA